MNRIVVLDVVGLSGRLLGRHTPHLSALARRGGARPISTVLPAVTCTVQSTFLTGAFPKEHGCVGDGWYFRELAEVGLWRQSNRLVSGEWVWDAARRLIPGFTVANLFWWHNLYSSVDWSVTPRTLEPSDGRNIPDLYTQPGDLRRELLRELGPFPLFHFWGPAADLRASRWIANAARYVYDTRKPSLTLVYLPHLDYDLQRYGPDDPRIVSALGEVDALCGELIDHVRRDGTQVLVLSEYGYTTVRAPVHINRALREAGLLRVREELGSERLDAGASEAFAVADHQVAHVYVRDPKKVPAVRALLEELDGVEEVLVDDDKRCFGLDHARSGELIAVARADRWFSYYHWLDDARAPESSRTVDRYGKPGADPCELFVDPELRVPALQVAWTVAKKLLGMRSLMQVVPLDGSLVRGSHGRLPDDPLDGPIAISSEPELLGRGALHATEVKQLILDHLLGAPISLPVPLARASELR